VSKAHAPKRHVSANPQSVKATLKPPITLAKKPKQKLK
jgi:hypothetical protein